MSKAPEWDNSWGKLDKSSLFWQDLIEDMKNQEFAEEFKRTLDELGFTLDELSFKEDNE